MSVRPPLTTIQVPRGDTIRHSKLEALHIQARWGHSLQMDMACMIWLETYRSGVGIGMEITAVRPQVIRGVPLRVRVVSFEVGVGIATGLAAVEHHIVATISRVIQMTTGAFAQSEAVSEGKSCYGVNTPPAIVYKPFGLLSVSIANRYQMFSRSHFSTQVTLSPLRTA